MGKRIRRTSTITLTETWTFVWAKADDAPEQTIPVVQETPKETQDEPLQFPISLIEPAHPSVGELPVPPLRLDPALEAQPDNSIIQSTASRKRKRAHGRRKRNDKATKRQSN